mmetsp:Transcript_9443/g.27747  ORF Transcript_9443/g.27747 Transcript_9443/m.27747 type:complete len:217 (+) Transcript_9443:2946-3596(+)
MLLQALLPLAPLRQIPLRRLRAVGVLALDAPQRRAHGRHGRVQRAERVAVVVLIDGKHRVVGDLRVRQGPPLPRISLPRVRRRRPRGALRRQRKRRVIRYDLLHLPAGEALAVSTEDGAHGGRREPPRAVNRVRAHRAPRRRPVSGAVPVVCALQHEGLVQALCTLDGLLDGSPSAFPIVAIPEVVHLALEVLELQIQRLRLRLPQPHPGGLSRQP